MTIREERDIYYAALKKIINNAPEDEPEEEDYDDTESAYYNGMDVGAYHLAEIAVAAIAEVTKLKGQP